MQHEIRSGARPGVFIIAVDAEFVEIVLYDAGCTAVEGLDALGIGAGNNDALFVHQVDFLRQDGIDFVYNGSCLLFL